MKNENIEELFESLDFDIATPPENHQQRFQEKLKNSGGKKVKNSVVISFWGSALAIAASFLLAFVIFQGLFTDPFAKNGELANISPEMATTQNYYASAIKQSLYELEQEKNPKTNALVQDALKQLEILESDYANLKIDLVNSGQDHRVIYAMIANFQQRIQLLDQVLDQINKINTKKNENEDNLL